MSALVCTRAEPAFIGAFADRVPRWRKVPNQV
jgi:hypothetical protein